MLHCYSSEDPAINLNYALLLFNSGDRTGAAKQFTQYQSKMRKLHGKSADVDPEVSTAGVDWQFEMV